MKHEVFILALIALGIVGAVLPVSAGDTTTISMSDLNLVGDMDVQIYGGNGTLLATYNTSSENIVLPNGTYLFIFKPSAISRLSNPKLMFTDAMAFVETYWLPMFLICALVVFAVRKW